MRIILLWNWLYWGNYQMLWIRFDEEDRRISAPPFCLNSIQGKRVCLQDLYEQNNLVLVFTHQLDCRECQSTIHAFLQREREYSEQASKVLFMLPGGTPEPQGQAGKDGFLSRLPSATLDVILLDQDGEIRRTYSDLMSASLFGESDTIIFVLDTYGASYVSVVAPEFDNGEVHEEILSWLQYINIQCPE
jgi:peroxiredoxin